MPFMTHRFKTNSNNQEGLKMRLSQSFSIACGLLGLSVASGAAMAQDQCKPSDLVQAPGDQQMPTHDWSTDVCQIVGFSELTQLRKNRFIDARSRPVDQGAIAGLESPTLSFTQSVERGVLDANSQWVYVGDGYNDHHIAKRCGAEMTAIQASPEGAKAPAHPVVLRGGLRAYATHQHIALDASAGRISFRALLQADAAHLVLVLPKLAPDLRDALRKKGFSFAQRVPRSAANAVIVDHESTQLSARSSPAHVFALVDSNDSMRASLLQYQQLTAAKTLPSELPCYVRSRL
jgi:hypothetical protein